MTVGSVLKFGFWVPTGFLGSRTTGYKLLGAQLACGTEREDYEVCKENVGVLSKIIFSKENVGGLHRS